MDVCEEHQEISVSGARRESREVKGQLHIGLAVMARVLEFILRVMALSRDVARD